jgi:cold shock CspA family protein
MQGTVKTIVADRGFGFITPHEAGQADTFFHMTALRGGMEFDAQLTGRRVEFDLTTDERSGRNRAANVRPVE